MSNIIIMNNIQLNKELLNIIKIPDILYSIQGLRKAIIKKLTKKTFNYYYIPNELQTFINEPNNYIQLDQLINIIINNYIETIDKPNSDCFSYNQKPNYNLIS